MDSLCGRGLFSGDGFTRAYPGLHLDRNRPVSALAIGSKPGMADQQSSIAPMIPEFRTESAAIRFKAGGAETWPDRVGTALPSLLI